MTTKQIQIAAKMYEARDTAKRLADPTVYRTRIIEFQGIIRQTMALDNTEILPAAMSLCQQVKADGFLTMWLVAAAVEMIEPS